MLQQLVKMGKGSKGSRNSRRNCFKQQTASIHRKLLSFKEVPLCPLVVFTEDQISRIKHRSIILSGLEVDNQDCIPRPSHGRSFLTSYACITEPEGLDHRNMFIFWQVEHCFMLDQFFPIIAGADEEWAFAGEPVSMESCIGQFALIGMSVGGDFWTDSFGPAVSIGEYKRLVQSVKGNISGNGKKHFGTRGSIFSFGVTSKFVKDGDNSYGRYAGQKPLTLDRKEVISALMKDLSEALASVVTKLSESMPIKGCIKRSNALLQALARASTQHDGAELVQPIGMGGYVSGHINFDASTDIPHCELDATYTIISAPKQHVGKHPDSYGTRFEFHINPGHPVHILMQPNTHIWFNAGMLTHRQQTDSRGRDFLNYSFYSNRRSVQNIIKSLQRHHLRADPSKSDPGCGQHPIMADRRNVVVTDGNGAKVDEV